MSGKIKFHKLRLPSSRSQNSQISNFFKSSSVEETSNSCPLPSKVEIDTSDSCCNSPQTKKPRSCSPFKMDEISLSPNMQTDDKSFSSKDSPEKMRFFDKTTSEFDFVPSPKERKTKKVVHNKPKVGGRKTERKQPKIKNVFPKDNQRLSKLLTAQSLAEGVNPDELQLALALSISEATQNVEEECDTQMNGDLPIGVQLEKFTYNPNCNRNVGEIEFFPLYYKRKGKAVNRFTALTMRNPKKQDQKVEKYVSQFLIDGSDRENLIEEQNEIDRITVSGDLLKCMRTEVSIVQMHAVALQDIENYFVKGVFEPTVKKVGCLLRDYRKIPGRSLSPEPILKKNDEALNNNCNEIKIEGTGENNNPTILVNDQAIALDGESHEELRHTIAPESGSPKSHSLTKNGLCVNNLNTSKLYRESSPDLFSELDTELDKSETETGTNSTIGCEKGNALPTVQVESKTPEIVMKIQDTVAHVDYEDCEISTYEKYSSDEVKEMQNTIQEPSLKSLDCVIDLTEGDECEINSSKHSMHSPLHGNLSSPEKFLSQDSLKSSSSSCIVLSDDEINYSIRKADQTLKKLKKIVADANHESDVTSEKTTPTKSFQYSGLRSEFQREVEELDKNSFLRTSINYLEKYQIEDELNEDSEKSSAMSNKSPHKEKEFDDDIISIDDGKTNFSPKSKDEVENILSSSSDCNATEIKFPSCSPLSEFDKILHDQVRFDCNATGSMIKNPDTMDSSHTNISRVVNDDFNASLAPECDKINDKYDYDLSNPSSPVSSNKLERAMHNASPVSGIGNVPDTKRSYNFKSDSGENNVSYQNNLDLELKLDDVIESGTSDKFIVNHEAASPAMSHQRDPSPVVYEITDSDSEEWKDPVIQAVDVLKISPLKNKKWGSVEDFNFEGNTSRVSKCLEEHFLTETMQNSTPKLSTTKFRKINSDSTLIDTTTTHKNSFRRHSSTKKFTDLIDDEINYSDLDEIDKLVFGNAAIQHENFRKPTDIDKLLSATIEGELRSSFSMDIDNSKPPSVIENLGTSRIETNTNPPMEEFVQDGVKYKVRYKNIATKPDYNDMDNETLIQELNKYGLKPLKKKQAVIMLEYIYNQMHPVILDSEIQCPASEASPENNFDGFSLDKTSECTEGKETQQKTSKYKSFNFEDCTGERLLYNDAMSSEVEDEFYIFPTNTRKKVSSCMLPFHVAWFNLVKSNRKLRQAILCYEPVDLQEVFLFFKSIGYRYDPKDIKSFFDKRCIIFRYDLSEGTNNRHTRKNGKRLKNIRASQR